MIRRPPRSTRKESSAASDVYERQVESFNDSVHSTTFFIYICLLYTSPSPRDTERSRMPSSA
ncbi:hypothetical protein [Staphylococcus aureus]